MAEISPKDQPPNDVVRIPAGAWHGAFDFTMGAALWAMGIALVGYGILVIRTVPLLSSLTLLVSGAIFCPLGDLLLARGLISRFPREFLASAAGISGRVLPDRVASVRGGIARVRTPFFRFLVAECPLTGIPWSDLVLTADWGLRIPGFVVRMHLREGRPGSMLLFFGGASARLPPERFPAFAESVLSHGGSIQVWIPRRHRSPSDAIVQYGTLLRGGVWLRLSSGLPSGQILAAVTRLYQS